MFGNYQLRPNSGVNPPYSPAYPVEWGCVLRTLEIVTRVDPLKGFYPAEDYHQDYLIRHPTASYIAMVDMPKIESLKRSFPELYRGSPVLANAR